MTEEEELLDCSDSSGASAGTGDCRCLRLHPRFG